MRRDFNIVCITCMIATGVLAAAGQASIPTAGLLLMAFALILVLNNR